LSWVRRVAMFVSLKLKPLFLPRVGAKSVKLN
jgi:hypothetical protein